MKNFIFLFIIGVLFFSLSCGKKNNPTLFGPYTFKSIFSDIGIVPKSVTVNADAGGDAYGSSGARYFFPTFFLERDSLPVTGDVQIQIAEYLKKSDMIFSSVLPTANGYPFISGGSFYINITQFGLPVIVARPEKFTVYLPQPYPTVTPGLSLFLGRPDDTIFQSRVNWQPADTSHGLIAYIGDTVIVYSDSIHYCAAGVMQDTSNFQIFNLNVTAPINTFSDTIMAYALYDNINCVWPMTNINNHVISESKVPNIPVHFVVFTVINGDFYAAIMAVTPISGRNYSISLKKTSPAMLKSQIDALP